MSAEKIVVQNVQTRVVKVAQAGVVDAASAISARDIAVANATAAANSAASAAAAAAAAASNATAVNGTSVSVRTPALGSMNWVYVETGRAPQVGMRLRIASRASPSSNYALGVVTAWSPGTSTVTLTVDGIGITPLSAADWNILVDGQPGQAGPTGAAGAAGAAGATGATGPAGTNGLTETTIVNKGSAASGTVTFNLGVSDRKQKLTVTGAVTLAFTGWPVSGKLGELWIEGTNFGAFPPTFPAGSWIKSDGTYQTTPTLAGIAFQAAGKDNILVSTDDAGATYLYSVLRG